LLFFNRRSSIVVAIRAGDARRYFVLILILLGMFSDRNMQQEIDLEVKVAGNDWNE